MLSVTLRQLELVEFNVIGRRKNAELRELSIKSYEMKIHTVSWLKTHLLCETFSQKFLKGVGWA